MKNNDEVYFKFISSYNYDEMPKQKTIVYTTSTSLADILKTFEEFLKGSGFLINGTLEIISEEKSDRKIENED